MHISPAVMSGSLPTQAPAVARDLCGGPVDACSLPSQSQRRPPLRGGEGATGGALGNKETTLHQRGGEEGLDVNLHLNGMGQGLQSLAGHVAQHVLQVYGTAILYRASDNEDAYSVGERENLRKSGKQLASCGNPLTGEVALLRNAEGKTSLLGTISCKSRFCLSCEAKKAASLCEALMDSYRRHVARGDGFGAASVTLTIPDSPLMSYEESYGLLRGIWKDCKEGKNADKFREMFSEFFDVEGWFRKFEATFSRDKIHAHDHNVMLIRNHPGAPTFAPKVDAEAYESASEEGRKKLLTRAENLSSFERAAYGLQISSKVWSYFQASLVRVVTRARRDNPEIYKHINLNKKEIIKRPYLARVDKNFREIERIEIEKVSSISDETKASGRWCVKGGVTLEVMRSGDAFAAYLAKEMSLSQLKIGRGKHSYSFFEMIALNNELGNSWMRESIAKYVLLMKGKRTKAWSKKDGMSYDQWLLENVKLEEKEPPKEPAVMVEALAKNENFASMKGSQSQEELAVARDLAEDSKKSQDWEQVTKGIFRNTFCNEEDSQKIIQRILGEMKEQCKRMGEARQRKRDKKEALLAQGRFQARWSQDKSPIKDPTRGSTRAHELGASAPAHGGRSELREPPLACRGGASAEGGA